MGTIVGQVPMAMDADVGENARITYQLLNTDGGKDIMKNNSMAQTTLQMRL